MITYIPRSKLEPHPDNPRKALGDLSELTASISDEEEAWMDGAHECFSYPHDEKEGGT